MASWQRRSQPRTGLAEFGCGFPLGLAEVGSGVPLGSAVVGSGFPLGSAEVGSVVPLGSAEVGSGVSLVSEWRRNQISLARLTRISSCKPLVRFAFVKRKKNNPKKECMIAAL